MKKALSFFIFFGIFVNGVYAVDYTGSLPPSLTLPSGTNENSKAIASCNSWDCIFGNESGSFTYSTSGAGSSTLTLTATIPPNTTSVKTDTPFYYSTLTINSGSNLVLSGFSSLTIGNSININGGSLSFSNNTATSGFGMRANGRVTLNNARFEIKAGVFTNYGTITASNQSAIVLTSRGNYTNNYGTITNENSTVTVQYDLWNLGQKSGGASPSSIATITNNGGTITIGGNLYNGGQNSSSGVYYCQVGFCGGGNLIINGGSVKVGGQLISQQMDGQASSISIYGGTLEVGQGLQNKQGSTLTFGVLGGTMGKLQGSLTNSGTVIVDMNGVALNTSYQIITGAITGLDKDNINVLHNNIAFLFVNYNNGTISLNTTSGGGGSGGGGGGGSGGDSGGGGSSTQQSPFEQYKNSQSAVGKVFLNALSSRFGGDDNLIASDINIQNAVATAEQETTKALKDNYVSQPTKMINAFKGDLLSAPLRKSVRTSRRLAAGDFIRFDNGKRVNAFASKASRDFHASAIGGVLRADDIDGYIAGFILGTTYSLPNYINRLHFAYAYGSSTQNLSSQSTDTKAHLFEVGLMNSYKIGILEAVINADATMAMFRIDNQWHQAPSLNASSNFNNYQLRFGLNAGPRLGKKLSVKPFAGIQNYLERQDGFKQDGGLGLESKAYNAYSLDGVLGVSVQYALNAYSSVFGKVGFEQKLYNSRKLAFVRVAQEDFVYENESYDNAISVGVGARLLTWRKLGIDAEALYKRYNTGLNYYGGSLLVRYVF